MKYHHIKNPFFNSNTFIIEGDNRKVILIDPGNPDIEELMGIIEQNDWSIEAVLLTHEHADHIAGLLRLCKKKDFPIYCSRLCAANIRSSKNNLSLYIDEIETFELNFPTKILNDKEFFTISKFKFLFLETPGHSPGGACILTADAIFTGDTILNKDRVPLNFPHSDREIYYSSLEKLKGYIKDGLNIFPGHGDPFVYNRQSDKIF